GRRPHAGFPEARVEAEGAGEGSVHLLGEATHHGKRTEAQQVSRVFRAARRAALLLSGRIGGRSILNFGVCHEVSPAIPLCGRARAEFKHPRHANVKSDTRMSAGKSDPTGTIEDVAALTFGQARETVVREVRRLRIPPQIEET